MQKVTEKTRYSESELKVFKDLLLENLKNARETLQQSQTSLIGINNADGHKLNDGAVTSTKEMLNYEIERAGKFIHDLEKALVRIETNTYGICTKTGVLIPKERLLVVPHATMTVPAKEGRTLVAA